MATFVDIDLSFKKHPVSKDLIKKTDVDAVKQSLRNIFNFNPYEVPFNTDIGIGLRGLLFENVTPQLSDVIKRKIKEQIFQYEPRCSIEGIVVEQTDSTLDLELDFYVTGVAAKQTINIVIERVR